MLSRRQHREDSMATTEDSGRTQRFAHIFARLQELQNYGWDPAIEPFHSVRHPYLVSWSNQCLTSTSRTTTTISLATKRLRPSRNARNRGDEAP